ncbi:MAG: histidinol dehydrogenase [Alphaproteobacteria bacterium]|nr:histidinol dehydrogenase [Alphaproteobacteria bacterium]MCB9791465.1 histidinol dehydrogenase [Alphaproteobacteria bacterium]
MPLLRSLSPEEVPLRRQEAVSAETLEQARALVEAVRAEGEPALRRLALRFGDLAEGDPLVLGPEACQAALEGLPAAERAALERSAARVRGFAEAQRAGMTDVEFPTPGGVAGLRWTPVERAGCYAPGGRFPLPSSVLMTALAARAAGVREVWVASPRPAPATLAAAALAGADGVLCVGGAQAIAALAYGAGPVPACDAIVGPGNRWVTAAKQLVAGHVAIDMLAGPSELVVLADESADPARVAADLLAQAEHDDDALPILVTSDPSLPARVDAALAAQLATLPTAATARAALGNGFSVVAEPAAALALCDALAPEHLALHLVDAPAALDQLQHFGALFVGEHAAEVLGDYGAGPNHVLPTGGTARSVGALGVHCFLRAQTWLRIDDPVAARELARDAAILGRVEGLEAHARAADLRG